MTCLVTGIAGFAGSHLAECLLDAGREVIGLALPGEDLSRLNSVRNRIDLRLTDITDAGALGRVLEGLEPAYVFHLAALASAAQSFDRAEAVLRVNTLGTLNLLEVFKSRRLSKFIYISSADVYGFVRGDEIPIRETHHLKPSNPYATSKAAAEVVCTQYWRTFAVPVVILRPFNHTGPRQGPGFAPSDFARAISRIEKGLEAPRLTVGNLDSQRDYSDVRDVVRAYCDAAEYCEPGEIYNISSGQATRIADLLEALLRDAHIDIEVTRDPAKARPSDTPVVVGDHSKFFRRTGWQPQIPFDDTLGDLLNWWRRLEQGHPGTA